MAAIVKPIEAKSVHLIQSGQVIVDLCSVVKELVENSLDAGANAVEIRFKNNGLDEIEVQDNGTGIASANYESVALKHHTSKLSTYDDLSTLQTFGFRGEALSSLCALSNFSVCTAQAHEAPKGHRLEFEVSGKLKLTSVVACQKGTIATVQNLFEKLPVRRKELAKNIKREYGKVLGLLHAYACISTNLKFTVKNAMPKAKSLTVFSTKSNATTRENIANIYGAKTLSALVALDLTIDYQQSQPHLGQGDPQVVEVKVQGHISRPVFGEGRQTPDRQMFFVNGRPCGLPQLSKAINEVYKSFNVSQSPFILADLQLDTSAYDVNVSPDKRTILLHDATALTESLKNSLSKMFDEQDQTVPQSSLQGTKLPAYRQLSIRRESSSNESQTSAPIDHRELRRVDPDAGFSTSNVALPNQFLQEHFQNMASDREDPGDNPTERNSSSLDKDRKRRAARIAKSLVVEVDEVTDSDTENSETEQPQKNDLSITGAYEKEEIHVRDFNARIAEQKKDLAMNSNTNDRHFWESEPSIPASSPVQRSRSPGMVQSAFDRMRPRRTQPELATITIGGRTIKRMVGTQSLDREEEDSEEVFQSSSTRSNSGSNPGFVQRMQRFDAAEPQRNDHHGILPNEEHHSELDPDANDPGEGVRTPAEDQALFLAESSESITAVHPPDSLKITDSRQTESGSTQSDEDDEIKAAERVRVETLIQRAEQNNTVHRSRSVMDRAIHGLKSIKPKDAVHSLQVELEFDVQEIRAEAESWFRTRIATTEHGDTILEKDDEALAKSVEERLSLTVSKLDFAAMHIVGQFNLGFILAVRFKGKNDRKDVNQRSDELFIIDQHASDEKYNFERLQAETVVGNQNMVRPATLELTAVEEEVVIDNRTALERNGFIVDVDMSGNKEVGRRCSLITLPISKEVVFGMKDLDELIHLIAEAPMLNETSSVPRPSKVRRMFAMRACRSSIMIGRTLSQKQMSMILQHMGKIDKPWNCPHGRPTMRHLASLEALESSLWKEGDGISAVGDPSFARSAATPDIWKNFVR